MHSLNSSRVSRQSHVTCDLITAEDVGEQRDRNAQKTDEQVGNCEIDDEIVDDGVHRGVAVDDADDHDVSKYAEEEHQTVGQRVDDHHVYGLFDQRVKQRTCR